MLRLGQGPLGELWAATSVSGEEQGRIVALRRIRVGAEERKRAARAAQTARALRHPKVAAVLDVIEEDGELGIVSEHVDGESLAALLRQAMSSKSPMLPSVALAIARDATDALIATRQHFAGQPGAPSPHGGLVSDGLIVAAFGDAVLTEPGVLAALGDVALRANALPYRAPEQLAASPTSDERSDVFSVGVLLWEMLANRPLFRSSASAAAEATLELRQKLLSEPIPLLDSLPRQGAPLAPGVTLIVARALMRDPAQRYATLNALREAFGELPRDVIASSEQVVVTLERLAKNALDTRREALSQIEERVSLSPGSVRITARPPSPDGGLPVVIPPGAFGVMEAPTQPRRKLTPVGLPTPDLAPPAPPPEPEPAEPMPPRVSTATGVSVIEDELGAPPRPKLRRLAPFALIAVGVVIVAVAVLARVGPSAGPATSSVNATATASMAAPALSSAATEVEPPEPEASESAVAGPAPSASARAGHSRGDRDKPQEVRRKDAGGYRPKGI